MEGGSPRHDEWQALEKIGRYAEVELAKEENAPIDPEDFAEIYRTDFDRRDVNVEVSKNENSSWRALQGMLVSTAELNNTFGEGYIRNSSNFDKKRNKVDLIAEYENEKGAASYLGVEVADGTNFSRKFAEIFEGIKEGDLTDVKYFQSGMDPDKKMKLGNIPRVIVGAGNETIVDAGSAWLDGDRTERKLDTHYLQYQTLVESQMQLDAFSKYARKVGRVDLVKTLEAMHSRISDALGDLVERNGKIPMKDLEKDKIFERLKEDLALEFQRVQGGGGERLAA